MSYVYVFIIIRLIIARALRCDNLSIFKEGGDKEPQICLRPLLATMRDGDKTEESLGKD